MDFLGSRASLPDRLLRVPGICLMDGAIQIGNQVFLIFNPDR
jgi:hypothetical protein